MLVIKTTEEFSQTPLEPSSEPSSQTPFEPSLEPSLEPKKTKGEIIINVDDLKSYNSYLFERENEIDLGTQHIDELDDDDIAKKMLTNKETFGWPILIQVVNAVGNAISKFSPPSWNEVLGPILGELRGKFDEAIRGLKPDWIDNIARDITEGIAKIFEPMMELILELGNTFDSIKAFTDVIGAQFLSFLQGGLGVFGDIFIELIESFLDVLNPLIKKGFVPLFKPFFWFIEPIMIFIFGEDGGGGIYDIIIRYMFYGIIVILFGIFLEILSISKIWAG